MEGPYAHLTLFLTLMVSWSVAFERTSRPINGYDTLDRGIAVKESPATLVVLRKQPLTINCSALVEKKFYPVSYHWKKDGVKIKSRGEHARVRVFRNGTLHFNQIIHRDRKNNIRTDEGFYECFVSNSVGTIIARRVQIRVARISKTFTLEPISQSVDVNRTVVFNCSIHAVTEAHFVWERNRQPITADNSKYILYQSGKLQVNHAKATDAGSYRCLVANKAFFDIDGGATHFHWRNSREAILTVNEAPSEVTKPFLRILAVPVNQTSVLNGDSATIECIADGNPSPTITWTRDGQEVLFDEVEKWYGGSLHFRKVWKKHAGVYKCHITQPGSDRVFEYNNTLRVLVKPVIEIGPQSATHPVARNIVLECKVNGEPPPTVHWLKDGQEVFPGGRFGTLVKEDRNQLRIYGVEDVHSAYYQCLADNEAGSASSIARIKIHLMNDAPNSPADVLVTVLSKAEAEVSWTIQKKKNASKPVFSYTVHYREDKLTGEEKLFISHEAKMTLHNLHPGTNYTVYVKAYNYAGASPSSEVVHFTTMDSIPRGFPTPTLDSTSSSTVLVKWQPMPKELRGGTIVKYRIYYGLCDTDTISNVEVKGDTYKYLITDLLPDSDYRVRLAASTTEGYRNFPDSEWPWTTIRTMKESASENREGHVYLNVTVDEVNMTTTKVSWLYPRKLRLSKQVIFLRNLKQSDGMQMYSLDIYRREITFMSLEPDTTYQFFVLGEQEHQKIAFVTSIFHTLSNRTNHDVPSQLTGNALLPNVISITWNYLGDNSNDVTHYIVRYKPINLEHRCSKDEKTFMTHSQEASLSNLEPFTFYNISVCAVFDDRRSLFSEPVVVRTLEDVPSPPENVEAVVISPGEVQLQWKPPHHPNGNIKGHVISYNVEVIQHPPWTELYQAGQDTAAVVQNLTARTYYFRVQACNGAGKGIPSTKLIVHMENFSTAERPALSDQQLGILGGAAIGLTSIIVTIILVFCKQRQFYRHHALAAESQAAQTIAVEAGSPTTPTTCACKREKVPPRTVQEPAPVAKETEDTSNTDPHIANIVGGRVYSDGCNTQAEELLALLAPRDGSYSTGSDSRSTSTDGTKEMSDDTATTDDITTQLTHDTAC
ncbi:protogenin-like isoform X2 [Haliotis rufescens]|uniref:protogenin-like isoform X2 n=1 Tax=Haliotis rufescens TaxID=6454 RepID=UPI00201E91BA|nr:protogenin-like isoform X2 [Haliotis rufescens]